MMSAADLVKTVYSRLPILVLASLALGPAEAADSIQTLQERAALANQEAGFLASAPDLLQRNLPDYKQLEFRAVKLGSYSFPLRRPLSWSFVICGEHKTAEGDEYSWQKFAITGGTGLKSTVIELDALAIHVLCVSNLEATTWLDRDFSAEVSPSALTEPATGTSASR